MKTFSELPLSAALLSILERKGFTLPTAVQAEAIPAAVSGKDLVATAQTGTGKTLAFVLPMIDALSKKPRGKGISALILSPTRELAMQIHQVFNEMAVGSGLKATLVVGGLSENTQLRGIKSGADVVVATPGRLCDFLQRKLAPLGGVSMLVLDEADRMLDMGFLPSIERIFGALPKVRQSLFFSATIEKSAARLIEKHLNEPVRIAIGTSKPAVDVDLHVYEVEQTKKVDLLQLMLKRETGTFLVFARTKHATDRLAKQLSKSGVLAAGIHGDRTQSQRNKALAGFKDGQFRVLVATDVAARGLHVDGIAHVVNFDLPQAPEDFIHRIGRTGRAGLRGTATTFMTRTERGTVKRLENALKIRLVRRDSAREAAA